MADSQQLGNLESLADLNNVNGASLDVHSSTLGSMVAKFGDPDGESEQQVESFFAIFSVQWTQCVWQNLTQSSLLCVLLSLCLGEPPHAELGASLALLLC